MYKKIDKSITYERIYLGASLAILIKAFFEKKNSIIVEQSNYVGGAWKSNSKKFKNLDLACHLIVPPSDFDGRKIRGFFKKYSNTTVRKVTKKEFYSDTDRWKSYGKKGPAMICEQGWPKLLEFFFKKIKKKKNLTFIKNKTVKKIGINNKFPYMQIDQKKIYAKKIYFPSYFSVKGFFNEKLYLKLPGKKINNVHYIIKLKCNSNVLNKNFQCFLNKSQKYLFDRVSVSSLSLKNNIISTIVTARLGKTHKRKIDSINEITIKKFLLKMGLVNYVYNLEYDVVFYPCFYRDIECRKISKKNLKTSKGKIEWVNTMYFGHFLSNLIDTQNENTKNK